MGNYDFNVDSPENYETKTICCFVVDVSGSMAGPPIAELNKGMQEFHEEISLNLLTKNRLEVGIVEFCDKVKVIQKPALVDNFTMPVLEPKGSTALVDGVRAAIKVVEERKDYYKNSNQKYKRPWIVLITDGAPDSDQDVTGLTIEIENHTKNKKFVFLPIGVDGANMSLLHQISGLVYHEGNWVKMAPLKMSSTRFSEFFSWLSDSMGNVSNPEIDQAQLAKPSPTLFDVYFPT